MDALEGAQLVLGLVDRFDAGETHLHAALWACPSGAVHPGGLKPSAHPP